MRETGKKRGHNAHPNLVKSVGVHKHLFFVFVRLLHQGTIERSETTCFALYATDRAKVDSECQVGLGGYILECGCCFSLGLTFGIWMNHLLVL